MKRIDYFVDLGRRVPCLLCGSRETTPHSHAEGPPSAVLYPAFIESQGLYHVLPGSRTLVLDVRRETSSRTFALSEILGEELPRLSRSVDCSSILLSGLEPAQVVEREPEQFRSLSRSGLITLIHTHGQFSAESLLVLQEVVDAAVVVVPTMTETTARRMGLVPAARLQAVIDGLLSRGIWVEARTELWPGVNDSEDEILAIAQALHRIDSRIPWHIVHGTGDSTELDLKMPPRGALAMAAEIADQAGLWYVYVPGVSDLNREITFCPGCEDAVLIERFQGHPGKSWLENNCCFACGREMDGLFTLSGPARSPSEHD